MRTDLLRSQPKKPHRAHATPSGYAARTQKWGTMAPMAIVNTGLEPGSGYSLVDERVYAQSPPGTQVHAEYQDFRVPAILGHDLWATTNIDDFHAEFASKGWWVYYISRWRNPANPIVGLDDYRFIMVYRA